MIESIVSINLFVDEKMEIKKHRLLPIEPIGNEKRICIVTGIHGDELEGQYVCYELIRRINAKKDQLKGIVDVYPALNPLGIDSISRRIPMFDMDMNRIFPGSEDGAVAEYVASKIIHDIEGAWMCLDVHSSNIFLRELPQIRLSESASPELLPYCKLLNVDLVWFNSKEQVQHATLAHSLNSINVPTMVIEMGVGMRITKVYGDLLVDGIFQLMKSLGIWSGEVSTIKEPRLINDTEIQTVSAEYSGIFIPSVEHNTQIKKGSLIGEIIDPLQGVVLENILAPSDGLIFTLREYPVVYNGSLIARVLGGNLI